MEQWRGELARIAGELADCLAGANRNERPFIKAQFYKLVNSDLAKRDQDARTTILKMASAWEGGERWVG